MADDGRVARAPLVPVEVLDYFRRKDLAPRFSWLDVWGEEHAHAFTVAKVTELDVLARVRGSIDRALAAGWGIETWKGDVERELRAAGWWGPRRIADPEGLDPARTVDLSRPRRLATIFHSNVRAARAAGQWERAQRTKAALPYLLYVRTTATEPRPEHLRWAGTILPIDHAWWRTHFPPNGWNCKCAVRQITRAEAQGKLAGEGYADTPPDDGPPVTFVNRRTGEVTRVPAGIDPGWHSNPGLARSRTLGRTLVERLEQQPEAVARAMVARQLASPGFEDLVYAAQSRGERRRVMFGRGTSLAEVDRQAPWRKAPAPVAVVPTDIVDRLGVVPRIVTADDAALGHNPTHHMAPFELARLQRLLDVGEVRRRDSDGALVVLARRGPGGRWWAAFLHPSGPGGRLELGSVFRTDDGYAQRQRQRSAPIRAGSGEVVAEGRP